MSSNRNQNDMNLWYEKVTKINFTIKNEYQGILNVALPPTPPHPPKKQKQTNKKTQQLRKKKHPERERNADGNQSWSDLCFLHVDRCTF